MGFDDVFEVSAAAELVSAASRIYVNDHPKKWPLISTACPSVVRLIRVRFPNLIDHMLPLLPPVEVASRLALEKAMEKTGLPREKIGIVFISRARQRSLLQNHRWAPKRVRLTVSLPSKMCIRHYCH